jgi:branched-chain amino acid transport system ATP-binding protein
LSEAVERLRELRHGPVEPSRSPAETLATVAASNGHAPGAATALLRPRPLARPPRPDVAPPALELIGVHAAYGRIEVLHGVDLVVPPSSVVALLGPNGAGKSTLLKVVSGGLAPTAGCVHISGVHVNGASPDGLARLGVCAIPEGRGVFANLSVAENLRMMSYRSGISSSEIEERAYARFPRLVDRRNQLAGNLSGGEQQMLSMARAVSTDPSLLLLDEISMGLAPMIVSELYELVAQLAAGGIAIVVVEQFVRTAMRVADYVAVMTQGRIECIGQAVDVTDAVSTAYMGAVG